ncbi:dnaJ homolog subfamily C member 7-like [Macrobrachium rosenbergii]|uniref:dnaJ homolog subfamily C member 7-like n=1 Tax=Macrobrachium rosenbergii TaxID=79674 RepID=UPI0034D3F6B8
MEELKTQAVDNDFYCGYLEQKVKAHEAERTRLNQENARLEERLRTSQPEVPVLATNLDVDKNQGNEENEKPKEKVVKRKKKVTVTNNFMANGKHKNNALAKENTSIGNIFCKLGHLEQASECFHRVLDVDNNQEDCRKRLALCLLLLGRHSEALVHLEKLDDRKDLVAAAKTLQRMQRHGCPYYILGIAEDATSKEIEWAYRKRALKFSPEKCQGSNEERERRNEIMKKVNHANDLLRDANEREEYDTVRKFIKDLAAKVFEDPQFSKE